MPARVVVVGGDAAGMTAASYLNRARPDVDVVAFERGPYTSYSMCGIPHYLGDEVSQAADLVVRSPERHREAGIDVRVRVEVTGVDAAARRVAWRDLDGGATGTLGYDALVLATGAHPEVPDLPGLAEHAEVVHTLDEGEALRAHLDTATGLRRAVIVGGGYIGLEVADAFMRRGLEVRLIDRGEHLMGSLDPEPAGVLAERLGRRGVELRLGEELTSIERDGAGGAVTVRTDRSVHEADLVVVATGAVPRPRLGAAAGCRVGPTGALAVDGRMRTTVPGIWAAGDCVETVNLVSGAPVNVQLGTHANKQGKVVGIDLAAQPEDGDATFPGVVGTAVTRVCGWEVARTGLTAREAEEAGLDAVAVSFTGTATAGYLPDAGEVHVLLRGERGTGRILGAQLVGTGNVAKRIDVAAVWCQLGVTATEAQFHDLSYAPPFGGVWDLLQVAARKLTRELGLRPQL